MQPKNKEKVIAIKLRRQGLSYSEIVSKLQISKASLSLWLREIHLTSKQRQRLINKSDNGRLIGAKMRRQQRLIITRNIIDKAEQEVGKITRRELWLIGTALHWAEGSKAKENNISCGVLFSNSDPLMIKLFIKWLHMICNIPLLQIECELYIHSSHQHRTNNIKKYWSNITGFLINRFKYTYYKKEKIKINRENCTNKYFGLVRIKVRRSTNLNRQIVGWVIGINKSLQDI